MCYCKQERSGLHPAGLSALQSTVSNLGGLKSILIIWGFLILQTDDKDFLPLSNKTIQYFHQILLFSSSL